LIFVRDVLYFSILFVHHSSINTPGFKTLADGQRVTFDAEKNDRGPVAKNELSAVKKGVSLNKVDLPWKAVNPMG